MLHLFYYNNIEIAKRLFYLTHRLVISNLWGGVVCRGIDISFTLVDSMPQIPQPKRN